MLSLRSWSKLILRRANIFQLDSSRNCVSVNRQMVNNGTFSSPTHGSHLTRKTLFHGKGEASWALCSFWLAALYPKVSLVLAHSLEENIMAWAALVKCQDCLLMQPFMEDCRPMLCTFLETFDQHYSQFKEVVQFAFCDNKEYPLSEYCWRVWFLGDSGSGGGWADKLSKSPFGRAHALFSCIGAVFPLPPLSCTPRTGAVKGIYEVYRPCTGRSAISYKGYYRPY